MVLVFGLPSDSVYVLVCALCNMYVTFIHKIALMVVLSSGTGIFAGLCRHKAKEVVFRPHQTGH